LNEGPAIHHHKETSLLQNATQCLELGQILWNDIGNSSSSGYGSVAGSHEHGNELLGSIKHGEFLD
jgi:hypothetical protein